MIRKNQTLITTIHIFSDGFLTLLAYFVALNIRFDLLKGTVSIPLLDRRFVLAAVAYSALIVIVYYLLHLYRMDRLKSAWTEMFTVLLSNLFGTLILIAALYMLRIMDFSRLAIVFFWALSSAFVIAKRLLMRGLLSYFRARGRNLTHVAVIGDGHLALQYLQDLAARPQLGICVDGYISAVEKPEMGRRLGSYEQLGDILQRYEFDELVIALEPHEIQFLKYAIEVAEKEGVRLSIIPFYNDIYPAHPTIETVGRTKLIDLRATPLDHLFGAAVKRSMDIAGALIMIVLCAPLMLAIAIGVKLSSPGPVLFRQERVGKNKKPFHMLKFRSMRVDADPNGWSVEDDPRKTKFGSFIRKFSLDELPQAFNVLVGQMSLVGPRPEIPFYVRQFKEEVPLYLVRQQVRPGMTGWAQIHGLRGNTSINARVEYDIWYIENWSLALDIKILFKTAFGGMINRERLPKGTEHPSSR